MSLTVYTGPMFASKTSNLVQEITRFSDLSSTNRALIINHSLDTRSESFIVSSHSSHYKGLSDKIDVISSEKLSSVDVSKYVVVGIDEANFFGDLVEAVKGWLKQGKHLVVSGLDSDYKMEKFGSISDLVHLADKFVKLNAVCSVCLKEVLDRGEVITPFNMKPAPFTAKLPGGNDELIDVGDSAKYVAVCRDHHKH